MSRFSSGILGNVKQSNQFVSSVCVCLCVRKREKEIESWPGPCVVLWWSVGQSAGSEDLCAVCVYQSAHS